MQLYFAIQVALHIATNPIFHERTKNIELDCDVIREKIEGSIKTSFATSTHQLTNIFTQPLFPTRFLPF